METVGSLLMAEVCPARTEFNNCFIIYLSEYTKKVGEPFLWGSIFKSHKLAWRHSVLYYFSIYHEITSNMVYNRVQYNSENLVWHCVRSTHVFEHVGHDRTLCYSQEGCCQLSQYYINQNRNNYQKSKTICIMVNKIGKLHNINDNLLSNSIYHV